MKKTSIPTFFREKEAQRRGYDLVIGVDEVGRGALAGPVVAGAIAFPKGLTFRRSNLYKVRPFLAEIDDSKKLAKKKREELDKFIRKNAVWGIGEAGVAFINSHGIVKATEKAMRAALRQAQGRQSYSKTFVLIDAFHVKYIPGVGLKNQRGIVKGDQKVLSIASASIIAKVYRDKYMSKLGKQLKYRKYLWHKNMGYGTREHQEAIKKNGLTRHHRKDFVD